MHIKNSKGQIVFLMAILVVVSMLMVSSTTLILATNRNISRVELSDNTIYELRTIEKLLLNQFVEQINDYNSVAYLSQGDTSFLYHKMIDEMYSSMTTLEGQCKYVSGESIISQSNIADGITFNKLLDLTTDSDYTEFIGCQPIKADLLNTENVVNFQGEDYLGIQDIELYVAIEYKGLTQVSEYLVKDVYATFVHQNENAVMMTLHSDEAKIERRGCIEGRNTQ